MDKYEYKIRSEEISRLIEKEKYAEAVAIADKIDWRRVKSATTLLRIAALYRVNRRKEDCRAMLQLAYDRYPTNRSVVHSLCEISIELDDVVAAIEYYKRFVKLAPRDNGVFTLRYRILAAQEASLEERIELLEELKKRDYQEEWAYELAYLYHRVGLATKCVEECDDLILWFGDGTYVMKAMELKMLHTPLTAVQQKKYEAMLNGVSSEAIDHEYNEYSSESYQEDGYQQEYLEEDYGNESNADITIQDNYENNALKNSYTGAFYVEHTYGTDYSGEQEQDVYANSKYPEELYSSEAYADVVYSDETQENANYQDYAQDGYTEESYPDQVYAQKPYTGKIPQKNAYADENYQENAYQNDNYANQTYTEEVFQNNEYNQESYQNNEYNQEAYQSSEYSQETYQSNEYGQEIYPSNEYAQESYSDGDEIYQNEAYSEETYASENGSYQEGDYANETYTDTNGIYADADGMYQNETYADLNQTYQQEEAYTNESYSNTNNSYQDGMYPEGAYSNTNGPYPNETYQEETYPDEIYSNANGTYQEEPVNKPVPSIVQPNDISQYNTINLQKVIADGMKEISFNDLPEEDEPLQEPEHKSGFREIIVEDNTSMRTNRVEELLDGISEEKPGPDTGAIRKVILPGDKARLIKAEADIEELHNTTERSVSEEQSRIENTGENIFHEQDIFNPSTEDAKDPKAIIGAAGLENVLVEWERVKREIEQRRKEKVRQHVLSQTGKIFENFDNSIKSGILGELEKDEPEIKREPQERAFLQEANTTDMEQEEQDFIQDVQQRNSYAQYPQESDSGEAYFAENYQHNEYMQEGYAKEDYADSIYANQEYSQQSDVSEEYPQESYINEGYPQESYISEEYPQESYISEEYPQESYISEENSQESDISEEYPQESDISEEYPLESDISEGYPQIADTTIDDIQNEGGEAESIAVISQTATDSLQEFRKKESDIEECSNNATPMDAASLAESNFNKAYNQQPQTQKVKSKKASNKETAERVTKNIEVQPQEMPLEKQQIGEIQNIEAQPQEMPLEESQIEEIQNIEAQPQEMPLEKSQIEEIQNIENQPQEMPLEESQIEEIQNIEVQPQEESQIEEIQNIADQTQEMPLEESQMEEIQSIEDRTQEMPLEEPQIEEIQNIADQTQEMPLEESQIQELQMPVEDTISLQQGNHSGYNSDDRTAGLEDTQTSSKNRTDQNRRITKHAEAENLPPNVLQASMKVENTEHIIPEKTAAIVKRKQTGRLPKIGTKTGNINIKASAMAGAIASAAAKSAYEEETDEEREAFEREKAEQIAEMAKEDALKTQEIKMNTADLSSLSDKIMATTTKEAKGARREDIREFTQEEQTLFENFAVTKKIKKQILYALDNMSLAGFTGNVIITGDAGLDTVRMAKNLARRFQQLEPGFSGKIAKITGEKINIRNLKEIFDKLANGAIIIEKANGILEEKLYEMAMLLNRKNFGLVVIMEDTRKEITKLLKKQAMIADYFNIRIDLMEMDNNALVAYARNYALALEYSIDELGILALYTRIANIQSGNHVVTKDEVRDIIDEAIWKSKKSKVKNFVDVLFAKRYDSQDMIVLKERDFI